MADDVLVLNEYPASYGAKHFGAKVTAERIVHNLNAQALGRGPAVAIAAVLRAAIGAIAAVASPRTLKARAVARRAFGRGRAGPRYGSMQPGQSGRLFNDSGTLTKSLAVTTTGDEHLVTVANNRFDPSTLDGAAPLGHIFAALRSHVAAIADPDALLQAPEVQAAIVAATRSIFATSSGGGSGVAELTAELAAIAASAVEE